MSKRLRTRNHTVVLNRSSGGDAGITVFLVLLGAFMFLPMVYSFLQSLKPLNELFYFPPRFFVSKPTLGNYASLFSLMDYSWVPFSRYIFNTVFISVAGTFGNLVLSSLAAYSLAKIDFPGNKFFFQIIQKSLMFTPAIVATLQFIIYSKMHWVDTYIAVIVPAWSTSLGLYLMKNFMDSNVTTEILESARLDGAREFRIFWSIAMPMVKPAWLTLIIYCFKDLWQMSNTTLIHSEQLKTLNYAIGKVSEGTIARTGVSAAGTMFIMIVPIAVFIISQSNIIETMGSSGMKD